MENQRARFKDAPWFGVNYNITVGGVGGIGSWLSFYLSRIGHTLGLYDFDHVDDTNLGGQLYSLSHVGEMKTESIKKTIEAYSGATNVYALGKFEQNSKPERVTFACFDSMKARKAMFEAWVTEYGTMKSLTSPTIFIDGRMTAESFQIYCVQNNAESIAKYRETLFDDNEVEDLPCSYKATSHIGGQIGSMMVQVFNNYLTNFNGGLLALRATPFKVYFESSLLYTEIEY